MFNLLTVFKRENNYFDQSSTDQSGTLYQKFCFCSEINFFTEWI